MRGWTSCQSVTKIFEDSKGKFGYCQTMDGMRGGISKIDKTIISLKFNLENNILGYGFNEIKEDLNGNILIGGYGLFIYDGNEIMHLKYGDGIGTGIVNECIC